MMPVVPRVRAALIAALLVFAIDRALKLWIAFVVMQPPRVITLTPFFNLVIAWNRGVSFSLFTQAIENSPLVPTLVAAAIVVALGVWVVKAERVWTALCLGMVIGGALGNMIDRLRYGAVIDFLDVHAGRYHWPIFNFADCGISVGVGLLVLDGLFGTRAPRSDGSAV